MIERSELEKISRIRQGNLYYLEKEYLLLVLLYSMYERTKGLIFKGGTCLRLAYNYTRLSVDLDFNTNLKINDIKTIVNESLKIFNELNIPLKIIKEEIFSDGYTSSYRFEGPLYNQRPDSTNSIRLDIGRRKTHNQKVVQINKIYSDIPQFYATCMSQEEILCEKVTTLFTRTKGRDLFDVWAMINNNLKLNQDLLKKKIDERKIKLNKGIKFCGEENYNNDLKTMLRVYPSYEQALKEVREFLIKNKVIKK